MFDLERAIEEWKKNLIWNSASQGDDTTEPEGRLRDKIRHLVNDGMEKEDAFKKAVFEFSGPKKFGSDISRMRTRTLENSFTSRISWFRPALLGNYFKVAWRKIIRQKGYSFISLTGLTISMAFFILLAAFIRDELTYDRNNKKINNLYLMTFSSRGRLLGTTPSPLAEALKAEFPEVRNSSRIWRSDVSVRYTDQIFKMSVVFADPALLEMFTLPLESGSMDQALNGKEKTVLTPSVARKLFGNENPFGKTVSLRLGNENRDFVVSGILREIPNYSSLRFDLLVPFSNTAFFHNPRMLSDWGSTFFGTIIELGDQSQAMALKGKLPAFYKKYAGITAPLPDTKPTEDRIGLLKLSDYHLGPVQVPGLEPPSNAFYSYILSGIALIILLLACFNYMNLSIGHAFSRYKEIGARKIFGAGRSQVFRQFIADSFLLSFFSLLLGIMLAKLFLPRFNALAGRSLVLNFQDWTTVGALTILLAFISFVAGGYPAALFSRLAVVDIFRKRVKMGGKSVITRSLVVLQFGLSIFLITVVLVMENQLRYIKNLDLGFQKSSVVVIPTQFEEMDGSDGKKIAAYFKNELRNRPQILAVSGSSRPLQGPSFSARIKQGDREILAGLDLVDRDYLETLGIRLLQGRNFSKDILSEETEAIIVNESFVRTFRLDQPIGKRLSEFSSYRFNGNQPYNPAIIGVIKDFHFESVVVGIRPLILQLRHPLGLLKMAYIFVKVDPKRVQESLAVLKEAWNKINPWKPFEYSFLDDSLKSQYNKMQNWASVVGYATGFAVFITCLGLVGLTTLATARRTKEIGIRKVLGSSVQGIVSLLMREFIWLIIIANILAWPAAYYVNHLWLRSFAFRIRLGIGVFILSAALAFVAALITIGFQTVKAALVNPVDSLGCE